MSERNILIAIIINAIVIFFLYFPQIEADYPRLYFWMDVVDHIFIGLFVIEAIIKLKVLKPKEYFKDRWNVFDFIIVIVSLPSIINFLPLFVHFHTSVLKILRLFRVIRVLRFIRFVPRMESIIAGLGRALKASVFVFLALFFLNFLLALFTCHFYGDMVPQYFGDPLISSYYIFQMFTVEGWYEIPTAIAEAAQARGMADYSIWFGATRFYFIIVVLTGGIFGMSLANAIFVDEMTSDNNQLVEEKIDELKAQLVELKELIKNGDPPTN